MILSILLSVVGSGQAFASHYDLPDVDFIPESAVAKLEQNKIHTTEDLFALLMGKKARAAFAKEYAMTPADVDGLAHKLELMQIVGIGPKAAALLQFSDIKNVKMLADAKADELLEVLQRVNRERNITGVQPDLTVVTDWIQKAQKITNHIEE